MNVTGITNLITVAISKMLPLQGLKCDRKIYQMIDPESGSRYELFKGQDGSLSIWETDLDGITTLWDCGEAQRFSGDMDLMALRSSCNV